MRKNITFLTVLLLLLTLSPVALAREQGSKTNNNPGVEGNPGTSHNQNNGEKEQPSKQWLTE
jgi:hypothetical protein